MRPASVEYTRPPVESLFFMGLDRSAPSPSGRTRHRYTGPNHSNTMPFHALGLAPALAQAAAELGFTTPTPIQAAAVPAVLGGGDVLATAQTGSGKTAAYVLPLLQRLMASPGHTPRRVRALVLVPTRELAAQVGEVVRSLAQHLPTKTKTAVVFGGVSINPQMLALRGGADVVVATPGRLLDLVEHNALKLASVELLVLDEADRLLDLGFADELSRVLALLPAARQNLFFSATFPPAVQELANTLLREPRAHRRAQHRSGRGGGRAAGLPGGHQHAARSCCASSSRHKAGNACWCSWPRSTWPSAWPPSCTRATSTPPRSMAA